MGVDAHAQPGPASGSSPNASATSVEGDVEPGLRGPRMGITPGIGVGFAGFTGNVTYPSFVFTTALQVEALLELTRSGFFLRGGFLSSGASGRWTAPTLALGTQYRLIGDGEERLGLVVRAGAIFEYWTATPTVGSCDIFYLIPNGCQAQVAPPLGSPGVAAPAPTLTADSVGLLVAIRLDMPVEPIYVAFDAELAAAADIDHSIPGAAITGQLVLTFALRDHPKRRTGPQEFVPRRRR